MFSSVSTTVLLLLAGVVGLLLGLLISTLFNREPKSSVDSSLPENLVKEGYAEAARLIYSPATKKVITQIDGDFYKDFIPLTPEQKKRVLRILQAWTEWCRQSTPQNESNANSSSTNEVAKPIGAVTPSQSVLAPVKSINLTLTDPIISFPTVAANLSELGIEVPRIVEPIPAVLSFGQKKTTAPLQKEPLTIVEQINEILKKLTTGTPDEKRQIRLTDNGHEGVTVWVGMDHYNGVDAVPLPEVQQLIRSAVARWEEETDKQMKAKGK